MQACEKLPGNYNPKITFIIAQKRHNTRFFPARQGQGECMRNGNVIPGRTFIYLTFIGLEFAPLLSDSPLREDLTMCKFPLQEQ